MSRPSSYLKLTAKQRIYTDSRLAGMNRTAAAAAAGSTCPNKDSTRYENACKAALVDCMNDFAKGVDFGRREAHDMYMDAYRSAETATEQIAAVNALVKLHGLEAPKKVEHKHIVSQGQIEFTPTDELMKIAEMDDLALEGEFTVIGDAPKLNAPEATEENTQDDGKILSEVPSDY